jgi:hypothetical protein
VSGLAKAHRRHAAIGAAALAAVAATVLLGAAPGSSQSGPPAVGPLPLLGVADSGMTLMGAAASGAPGEAWGYRELPLTVDEIDGSGAGFGPIANPLQPSPQLAFLRHTDASGWRVAELPLDEHGQPYRGMVPNRLSARVTPNGGALLAGRDPTRPVGTQVVLLRRDPGGDFRAVSAPPPSVLLPAAGNDPAEELAEDQGGGRIAIAAFDEGAATSLFVAPTGRAVADAILRFDGSTWTREPLELPTGSEARLRVLAIDATAEDNAWALVETDPSLGRGVVLMQRTTPAGNPLWVERDLGTTPFAARDTPGIGVAGLAPLGGSAQPLTVTTDGVWVDAAATVAGVARDITLHFDPAAGAVTGSWCDAPALCSAPLGARFSRQGGYRSFAWPGTGFGTRVITNPLDQSGAEDSNRGAYLRLTNASFTRMPGGGGNFRPSGAFASADDGWLEGPVQISPATAPARLRPWPVSLRAPLTDVTAAPGATPGAVGSGALAVGADGSVARYVPGRGWRREFLLSSSGSVNRATLRGVAWPEPARAHAVGDLGAMWQWNADDGLWSADPGIPIGFEGNLLDVAFEPGNPDRGYAVGKGGVLLAYGKSWEQEPLPAGYAARDLTSIAFAGGQAIVAAGSDLLVNDGGGWRVDASAHALLTRVAAGRPQIVAVAGLPDGGAIAAGRDVVLERESAGAPWRFSAQPLPGSTAIAAAATRPGGGPLRAVVSVVPQLAYPPADDLPEPDPNVPPPILPPFQLPGDGYVMRETADGGWADDQRSAFSGSSADRPLKSDPVLALLLDSAGNGWAVGGWSGDADAAGRGSSARNGEGRAIRARVRTAGIYRYGDGAAPTAAAATGVPLADGPVRLAVAGHAQCDAACADLAPQSIGPDRTLASALRAIAAMRAQPGGPRALLYTGNRVKGGLGGADGARYAQLLGSQPGLPVFPVLGSSDAANGLGAAVFRTAFAGFAAPFGSSAAPAGISAAGIPGAAPGSGARTHYAFDSDGPGGRVRVVVIDNSLGSLAASDLHQNPAEPQLPWLIAVLDDARADGVPAIVMGNRDLNTRFTPKLNVASDGDEVARVLVEHGASAYVYDRPEENRVTRIPAAAAQTIPSYGTGTLGYRSPLAGAIGVESADALFGDSGVLLLELRADRRDPATNRAPVSVRLVPVIEDLSLEATDGTLLRRSRPALFRGLGRKPRGGDRWGRASAGSGNPDPSGGDPYTSFPPEQCLIAGCSARIQPEYGFRSSDPDIADFVLQDPNSTNLRKPLLGPDDKVVSASGASGGGTVASARAFASQSAAAAGTSGLLCPFNAGTTTVTVSAGGFSYSELVTVLDGSVQRPCGTRPLRPDRFRRAQPGTVPPAPPPPPAQAPAGGPPLAFEPPPLLPAPPPAVTPPTPPPAALAALPLVPLTAAGVAAAVPAIPPPPPPPVVRPMPPGGAPARTYQVEEKREEEAATEESQAFSRYSPDDDAMTVPPYLPALVLLLAVAGAAASSGGPGSGRRPAPATSDVAPNRRRRQ